MSGTMAEETARLRRANPYREAGRPATPPRLVGRQSQIHEIRSVWSGEGRPSNLRVIGQRRIGKTSLVRHAFDTAPARAGLIRVWMDAGLLVESRDLYRGLTRRVREASVGADLPEPAKNLLAAQDAAVQRAMEWYDLMEAVRAFFATLCTAGIDVLLVLDGFDRTGAVFKHTADFQLLRDLASEGTFSLGLITVSRREVEDIEVSGTGGSTLGNVVLDRLYVGLLSDQETDLLLSRAAAVGVGLASVRAELTGFAGLHPFLLESLCRQVVDGYAQDGRLDVPTAFEREAGVFDAHFRKLVDAVRQDAGEDVVTQLKRIAAGETAMRESVHVDRLVGTGVLERSAGRLTLFSPEFARYVALLT